MRKLSPVLLGENHGRWEESGNAPLIILRYMGSGMYERCGSELERPYLPPKGKEETNKHKRNRNLGRRESEGFIIPMIAMEQNIT